MSEDEKELGRRLAEKMAPDLARGDGGYTQAYYLRLVALDLIQELSRSPREERNK